MQKVTLSILLVSAFTILVCGSAAGGFPPCAGTVRAEDAGGAINVFHDQAEWNCCAAIVFQLSEVQDTLDLLEFETFEVGPCDCICCFDLSTSVLDVSPGEYLVRVLNGHTGEIFGEVWVTVQVGPGGACSLGETCQSSCGGWNASLVEVTNAPWGRIKSLFR